MEIGDVVPLFDEAAQTHVALHDARVHALAAERQGDTRGARAGLGEEEREAEGVARHLGELGLPREALARARLQRAARREPTHVQQALEHRWEERGE